MKNNKLQHYGELLADVKSRIRQAQTRAVLAVNAELVRLYWDIGRLIAHRQQQEGWGAGVIPRLAQDLHNELPEMKGFSERNIKLMVQFCPRVSRRLSGDAANWATGGCPIARRRDWATAGCPNPLGAQCLLMQRVKDESGSPLVYAGHVGKRMESEYAGADDRHAAPTSAKGKPSRTSTNSCPLLSPTWRSKRSKTPTSSTS